MRYTIFIVLLILTVVVLNCTVGEWEHGTKYEQKTGHIEGDSPYMPSINDEEELRKRKLKNWSEIHCGKQGLVGYLLAEETDYYKPSQSRTIYYVYNIDSECIGFFTENGETYRFHFDNYRQQKEMIGHYEAEEACMHLLGQKNLCELKPLSTKPPKE